MKVECWLRWEIQRSVLEMCIKIIIIPLWNQKYVGLPARHRFWRTSSCCDCVYHPYCGVCPVINLALENNIYERRPNNYRCRIYKGILDTLFELIEDKEVEAIFTSWI